MEQYLFIILIVTIVYITMLVTGLKSLTKKQYKTQALGKLVNVNKERNELGTSYTVKYKYKVDNKEYFLETSFNVSLEFDSLYKVEEQEIICYNESNPNDAYILSDRNTDKKTGALLIVLGTIAAVAFYSVCIIGMYHHG